MTEALWSFRHEHRLVALVGAWSPADALIGFDPVRTLNSDEDPFDILDRLPEPATAPGDAVFGGGWIGNWGYQLGRRIELLPPAPLRPVPTADFHLSFYEWVLLFAGGQWWFEASADAERLPAMEAVFDRVAGVLAGPAALGQRCAFGEFEMSPGADRHQEAIAKTRDHLAAGDIFQANICVRLEATYDGDPLDAFCAAIDDVKPAYGAFVRTDGGAIASLSPELFLRRRGDSVVTSPIKGTAPLDPAEPYVFQGDHGVSPPKRKAQRGVGEELAASPKDRAENIMIVDLMRNDLGRVCEPGSIAVTAMTRAERHTVWHLVSDIVGTLRPGLTDADLLRATFPPGSVTGAPKVRAMEIIGELETTAREAYTGAIGFASVLAGLELNVAIRTFEFHAEHVWLGVGGGVVIDSTPEGELAECLVKAIPLLHAVGAELQPQSAAVPVKVRRLQLPDMPRLEFVADPAAGVFDTLLVRDGVAVERAAHLGRLVASIGRLYGVDVAQECQSQADAALLGLRGRHRLRIDYRPDAGFHTAVSPIDDDHVVWRLAPVTVPGGLGAHKWCDRPSIGGVRAAEPLICDADGVLLETSRANLFVVHDDGVYTAPTDGRILGGVMRSRVLQVLRDAQIPVFERPLRWEDLGAASEVFATNALRGVVPVIGCETVGDWPSGRTTAWLRRTIATADGPAEGSSGAVWPVGGAKRGHIAPLGEGGTGDAGGEGGTGGAGGEGGTGGAGGEGGKRMGARVLLIDNYDSFVYNLAQYFGELGATTEVVRNDAVDIDTLMSQYAAGAFTHLVISPGPGKPEDAGISVQAVARLGPHVPTLGVCLGHECIGQAYGADVIRADRVVHGKPSLVHHDGRSIFAGLASPLVAGRYHSLVLDPLTLPESLEITARTATGVIMGIRHRVHPIAGIQLHPESILTTHGREILARFLDSVG